MARAMELKPEDLEKGPLDRRLEMAVNLPLDAVLIAMAERMAGGGNPRMFRSKGARRLLMAGAAQVPGLLTEAAKVADRLRREEAEKEALAETGETSHSG